MCAKQNLAVRNGPRFQRFVPGPSTAHEQFAVLVPLNAESAERTVLKFALIHMAAGSRHILAETDPTAVLEISFIYASAAIDLLAATVQLAVAPLSTGLRAVRTIFDAMPVRLIEPDATDVAIAVGKQQCAPEKYRNGYSQANKEVKGNSQHG